jgi:hypothetical protein
MTNVEIIEVFDGASNQMQEHAIIDRGNGKFESMPKSTYDAQQAALADE